MPRGGKHDRGSKPSDGRIGTKCAECVRRKGPRAARPPATTRGCDDGKRPASPRRARSYGEGGRAKLRQRLRVRAPTGDVPPEGAVPHNGAAAQARRTKRAPARRGCCGRQAPRRPPLRLNTDARRQSATPPHLLLRRGATGRPNGRKGQNPLAGRALSEVCASCRKASNPDACSACTGPPRSNSGKSGPNAPSHPSKCGNGA